MELTKTIKIEKPEDDVVLAADKEARGWSPQTRSPTTAAATTSTEKSSNLFTKRKIIMMIMMVIIMIIMITIMVIMITMTEVIMMVRTPAVEPLFCLAAAHTPREPVNTRIKPPSSRMMTLNNNNTAHTPRMMSKVDLRIKTKNSNYL